VYYTKIRHFRQALKPIHFINDNYFPNYMKVCITGASSGIGREFAYLLAKQGYELVLVARRKEKLDEIKRTVKVPATVIVCDLAKQSEVEKLGKKLSQLRIDILINNAGFGEDGKFQNQTTWKDMIQVNITTLTTLTHMTLSHLKGVINVGSVAGFVPGPNMSVYFATKAYVQSFSEALAAEKKVQVTVLCPGRTQSEFFERAKSRTVSLKGLPTAKEVAEYGWGSYKKGKVVAIHGVTNKLLVFLVRFLPRSFVRWLVTKV
jgi:uncharacterized protein